LRVWIIQEVSLAGRAFFMQGSHECTWENLCDAAHFVRDRSLAALIDVDPSSVLHIAQIAGGQEQDQSILDLVHRARACKSSDSRNEIYATFGLASDGEDIIPVYKICVKDCYSKCARSMIEKTASRVILNEVEHWAYYATTSFLGAQLDIERPSYATPRKHASRF
jgi:hypothetical protein